jgi:ubiquinone/menaquinone biosynthesis C-methylase UbiE
MLEWMQENICPQYPDILPTKMQEKEVPLEEGIADLVYMLNLHHELDDPQAVLREAYRILKSKGKLFIVDWKKEDMSEGPPTHIRYLPEQITKQMQETDFKNINVFLELPKHYLIVAQKE